MAIDENVIVVADGMGGHPMGREAAKFVCDHIFEQYSQLSLNTSLQTTLLTDWINEANTKLLEKIPGSGTTCSVLVIRKGDFFASWVGDTRIYLFRENSLHQISTDQNLATTSGTGLNSHVLTNHVGKNSMSSPGKITGRCMKNDVFLIATDGAYSSNEDAILNTLEKHLPIEEALTEIEEVLIERDPTDNFTIAGISSHD